MSKIRVAVVGVGNCCSALVQGIDYYSRRNEPGSSAGLMHPLIGDYRVGDIEVVCAFDIDQRKVGKPLEVAVFASPNCTTAFNRNLPPSGCIVAMSPVLDGVAGHMGSADPARAVMVSDEPEPDKAEVVERIRRAGADVFVNYLPVGAERASRFYAECALEAGVGFINSMPTLIASDPAWESRFADRTLPIIGDDIKSQLGATIVHRALADLFRRRGAGLERTYQLNFGGNTDFLNMLDRDRLATKKLSKTEAVQSAVVERLASRDIHIGPSDYVPWLSDNKVAYIRLEGRLFGDVAMNMEVRLSVEDSPNSAGVAVDMIRCAKLALDRGVGGCLVGPSAFYCKHPPVQLADDAACRATEEFIANSHGGGA